MTVPAPSKWLTHWSYLGFPSACTSLRCPTLSSGGAQVTHTVFKQQEQLCFVSNTKQSCSFYLQMELAFCFTRDNTLGPLGLQCWVPVRKGDIGS